MKTMKNKKKIEKARKCFVRFWGVKEPGVDGILVTVGLCIIALLLCVVMKDSLTGFIQTVVTSMTSKANEILNGVSAVPGV